MAHLQMKSYDKSKIDFESLKENENFSTIANYHLGNLAMIEHKRELAVSFWLKANANKNEDAQSKLDLFHTFTGNYLLLLIEVNSTLESLFSFLITCENSSK